MRHRERLEAGAEPRLPLTSLVTRGIPSHPLPHLVLDPVLDRLAKLEASTLASKPARWLRQLGASDQTVVGLVAVALVTGLARSRRQWRAFVVLLGVGEAVGRTLDLIDKAGDCKRRDPLGNNNGDNESDNDEEGLLADAQHVLSFWTLFFSVTLYETLRTSPAAVAVHAPATSNRFRSTLSRFRQIYLRFVRMWIVPLVYRSRYAASSLLETYPRLSRFPTLPFSPGIIAQLVRRPTRRARRSNPFPEPLPATTDVSSWLSTIPLAHSYFVSTTRGVKPTASDLTAAEIKWNVVKLLVLWTGLRRDGFGAKSVLFDWIVGPIVKRTKRAQVTRTYAPSDIQSAHSPRYRTTPSLPRTPCRSISPASRAEQYGHHYHAPSTQYRVEQETSPAKPYSTMWSNEEDHCAPRPGSLSPGLTTTGSTCDSGSDPGSATDAEVDSAILDLASDSLLLESPPRLFKRTLTNENGFSTRTAREDEADADNRDVVLVEGPSMEAEEGIKRWAAVHTGRVQSRFGQEPIDPTAWTL
ncbi:uncharacterized protein JCM15063_000794 [Sporobolomyces koalae]|uniref:uncharacterized protein n=1 Tax=Sporobolomyces koalae TaxID=500713 RepID=UPI003171E944